MARPAVFWVSVVTITLGLTFSAQPPTFALTVRAEDTPHAVNTERPQSLPEDPAVILTQTPDPIPVSTPEPAPKPDVGDTGTDTPSDSTMKPSDITRQPAEVNPAPSSWFYVPPTSTRRSTSVEKRTEAPTPTLTPEPTAAVEVAPTAQPSAEPTPEPTHETVITEVDYTTPNSAGASTLAIIALSASLVLAALLGGWVLLYKPRLANRPTIAPFKRRSTKLDLSARTRPAARSPRR